MYGGVLGMVGFAPGIASADRTRRTGKPSRRVAQSSGKRDTDSTTGVADSARVTGPRRD